MEESLGESPAELRISYEVSREEYMAAAKQATQTMLQSVKWGNAMYFLSAASVACGIAIGMGYIELVNGYIGRNWRLQWLIAVVFLAVCLLTIWQQRLRAARIYSTCADDNLMLGAQALTVTAAALVHEACGANTQVAWPAIKQVVRWDQGLLIVLKSYAFIVVPGRAFSGEAQYAEWIAMLRKHAAAATHDVTRAGAGDHAVAMRPDATLPVPPDAPDVPGTPGLCRNLKAGVRLACFRRVAAETFVSTPEAFIALALLGLLVLLASGMARVGLDGQFNYHALPASLMFVPLLLLFGVVAARAARDQTLLLAMPVALLAAGLMVTVAGSIVGILIQQKLIVLPAHYGKWLAYFYLLWWAAIIVFASWRFAPTRLPRTVGVAALGVALLALPSLWSRAPLWIPAYNEDARNAERDRISALADEKGFYAQHDVLRRALSALRPERPGIADIYALTAGLYAAEDVFMKETRLIDTLLRQRFDADGRSLLLVNNPGTVHEFPVASRTSIDGALRHIGTLMNREEDILVLYVSSHGSQDHQLSVDFWPLRLQAIDPPALKKALRDSGIKWKVVVVSACYSGGFVEPLKDDNTLIITASSATKTSFGCGSESDATYLAKALFDEALRKTYSFETAFELARQSIRRREAEQGQEPSEPQIFVGPAIRDKLLQVEKRLSARER